MPGAASRLAALVDDAPFTFVVGKGGVGKTTAAGALALHHTDSGSTTHLISTDPAHSIGDLFDQRLTGDVVPAGCAENLMLEAFDASAYGDAWMARAIGPVTQIIESGTYLDAEDVRSFSRLALPGLDELMAVLRLVDLARAERRVVVDTAPTGHTLRLLDAAATHEGIARALSAMAEKAAAVAGSFAGRAVRLKGESIIDELRAYVDEYRERVLRRAAFVIATRSGRAVEAESQRLAASLRERGLGIVASVSAIAPARIEDVTCFQVPKLAEVRGCTGLRAWMDALRECDDAAPTVTAQTDERRQMEDAGVATPALPWLHSEARRVLLFAGKGGVGKSTCAAAAAVALAQDRDVLLCSADPAGSLQDILGDETVARLRVLQIQPETQLERLREAYRADVLEALAKIGISGAAALDRRVIESLWELTPPGLDELSAMAAMLDAATSHETVVLDAAPTGHFLRLLEMPEVALAWTHQIMRVIVKYGIAGASGGAAQALLDLARELKSLRTQLHDAAATGVFVVTLNEPMVEAESERLLDTLHSSDIPVQACVINRASNGAPRTDVPTIAAPQSQHELTGVAALREWVDTWKMLT